MLSITVILGYTGQKSLEPDVTDEIDAMKGLLDVEVPIELVIVDRAWPTRWERIKDVFEPMIRRIKYIPVRPTKHVIQGRFVVSGAMNSGAICSSGELLLSSGDFNQFTPDHIHMMYRGWFNKGRLYAPLVDCSWAVHQVPKVLTPSQGINVGPRLYTRGMLAAIGGWEEAFDGSRGLEDEIIDLCLDKLLEVKYNMQRYRHPDLIIHKVRHENGAVKQSSALRCNLAFAQHVSHSRITVGSWRANRHITDIDIRRMRQGCDPSKVHKSVQGIPISAVQKSNRRICCCKRDDREEQLKSYLEDKPLDLYALQQGFTRYWGGIYGCFNPWNALSGLF